MRVYLDDDSAERVLTDLLRRAGHDVQLPIDAGLAGAADAVHLTHSLRERRLLISRNHKDFQYLHRLVLQSGGHHPGILIVRRDNDPTRDMSQRAVVNAIGKLLASGVAINDELHVLNHWR